MLNINTLISKDSNKIKVITIKRTINNNENSSAPTAYFLKGNNQEELILYKLINNSGLIILVNSIKSINSNNTVYSIKVYNIFTNKVELNFSIELKSIIIDIDINFDDFIVYILVFNEETKINELIYLQYKVINSQLVTQLENNKETNKEGNKVQIKNNNNKNILEKIKIYKVDNKITNITLFQSFIILISKYGFIKFTYIDKEKNVETQQLTNTDIDFNQFYEFSFSSYLCQISSLKQHFSQEADSNELNSIFTEDRNLNFLDSYEYLYSDCFKLNINNTNNITTNQLDFTKGISILKLDEIIFFLVFNFGIIFFIHQKENDLLNFKVKFYQQLNFSKQISSVETILIKTCEIDISVKDIDNQNQFILINFDGKRFSMN